MGSWLGDPLDATVWVGPVPAHWPSEPLSIDARRWNWPGTDWTYQTGRTQQDHAGYVAEVRYTQRRAGLPFRSLGLRTLMEGPRMRLGDRTLDWYKSGWRREPAPWWQSGVEVPRIRPGLQWQRVGVLHMPVDPLWPGFLANSLVYAVALGLLWFSPGMLRRRYRRRELCVHCGYPLGIGTICPECGGTVPAVASPKDPD